jgi:hypothetical protein
LRSSPVRARSSTTPPRSIAFTDLDKVAEALANPFYPLNFEVRDSFGTMLRIDRYCIHCLKYLPAAARSDTYFCPVPVEAPKPARSRRQAPKRPPESPCWRSWKDKRLAVRRSSASMAELEKKLGPCAEIAVPSADRPRRLRLELSCGRQAHHSV